MKTAKIIELPKSQLIESLKVRIVKYLNEESFDHASILCNFLSSDNGWSGQFLIEEYYSVGTTEVRYRNGNSNHYKILMLLFNKRNGIISRIVHTKSGFINWLGDADGEYEELKSLKKKGSINCLSVDTFIKLKDIKPRSISEGEEMLFGEKIVYERSNSGFEETFLSAYLPVKEYILLEFDNNKIPLPTASYENRLVYNYNEQQHAIKFIYHYKKSDRRKWDIFGNCHGNIPLENVEFILEAHDQESVYDSD